MNQTRELHGTHFPPNRSHPILTAIVPTPKSFSDAKYRVSRFISEFSCKQTSSLFHRLKRMYQVSCACIVKFLGAVLNRIIWGTAPIKWRRQGAEWGGIWEGVSPPQPSYPS